MSADEKATLTEEHHWRDDPVLTFILDPATARTALKPLHEPSGYHPTGNAVSHRRTQLAGLALLQKRCRELGWPELTADVALAWQREARS